MGFDFEIQIVQCFRSANTEISDLGICEDTARYGELCKLAANSNFIITSLEITSTTPKEPNFKKSKESAYFAEFDVQKDKLLSGAN